MYALADVYRFAAERHAGQLYATLPYQYHLDQVVKQLAKFGFTSDNYVAAGLLHDVIEDTPTTLQELGMHFGDPVASLVWACTGIGKNRKHRNYNIYDKLLDCPQACVIKVCDRLANHAASVLDPSTSLPDMSKVKMYLGERYDFENAVRVHIPVAMWDALQESYEKFTNLLQRSTHAVSS